MRVNGEMVELEPLDAEDFVWLRHRVECHRHETGSEVAARLLTDWATTSKSFVKVMPVDYKRVMVAAERARAEGTDEVAAVMAAAHG